MLFVEGGETVDVLGGVAERRDWVVLESGLLATREDAPTDAISPNCTRLRAGGLYVVPGLIDVHVHLGRPRPHIAEDGPAPVSRHLAQVAAQNLRAGVTMVRDLGDRWPHGVKVAEAAQRLDYPRVISALSGLTTPNGYGLFLGEAVRDTDDLLAAVHRRYEAGARLIKLFLTGGVSFATGTVASPQFDRRTVRTAATAAHDLGLPLVVHANGAEAVMDAVLAGADTIEHGILVNDEGLRAMAEHGVFWVPTLTPLWRALEDPCDADEGTIRTTSLRRIFQQHQDSVARAFELGVKVVAGTDAGSPAVPHGCLSGEIDLFVAAGVHPALALKSATIRAAEALGVDREIGLIGPGRRGDLLLLRRNPLETGAALKEIHHVICGGKIAPFGDGHQTVGT